MSKPDDPQPLESCGPHELRYGDTAVAVFPGKLDPASWNIIAAAHQEELLAIAAHISRQDEGGTP